MAFKKQYLSLTSAPNAGGHMYICNIPNTDPPHTQYNTVSLLNTDRGNSMLDVYLPFVLHFEMVLELDSIIY